MRDSYFNFEDKLDRLLFFLALLFVGIDILTSVLSGTGFGLATNLVPYSMLLFGILLIRSKNRREKRLLPWAGLLLIVVASLSLISRVSRIIEAVFR